MDWHCLGHASWLAEVDGLRILFDPLLESLHFGGVFEVVPNRTVHADALRADFIFVSHRHPDHFDVASLRRLATIDPDTVLVTSDDLVASVASRLGFRTVRVVPPETTIDLDGPRLITTPSLTEAGSDPEWGVVVANEDGVVYNQIDTSIGSPAEVRAFFQRAFDALQPNTPKQITLGLARWHPLLEINSVLAGSIGFPFRAYHDEIERCHALDAKVVVPSSAGARHTGPHAFMNRLVYPTTEAAFIRDARLRCPRTRFERNITGATYRIEGHEVNTFIDPKGGASLVSIEPYDAPPRAPRQPSASRSESSPPLSTPTFAIPSSSTAGRVGSFRPLEIPPIVDPNVFGRTKEAVWQRIETWTLGALVPALGAAHARQRSRGRALRELRWLLEVALPHGDTRFISIVTGRRDSPPMVVVREDDAERPFDADEDLVWDVRCAVAGSLLVEVLDGQRHWGELLLGGMLRACSRACDVDDERGVVAIPLQPLFVYEALSYEDSILRQLQATENSR